jgi:hypothetical protein
MSTEQEVTIPLSLYNSRENEIHDLRKALGLIRGVIEIRQRRQQQLRDFKYSDAEDCLSYILDVIERQASQEYRE